MKTRWGWPTALTVLLATTAAEAIPPGLICGGWGVFNGGDGVVAALMRFAVEGATPSCAGL